MPLSFAQEPMWFFSQYHSNSALYNLPVILHLTGPLDLDALQRTLDTILERHESLRTRFLPDEGQAWQVVYPPEPVPLVVDDLERESDARRGELMRRYLDEECRRPFDLSRDTLVRARLIRLGSTDHVLVLVKHHIATDGWSENIFLTEWAALYEGFASGRPASLPALPLQYPDFSIRQREGLGPAALAPELSYWRKQLAGAPALLELPTDFRRPARMSFKGAWQRQTLSPAVIAELQALGRREGATLFMVLLAAFKILLHRCSRSTDIVVATPVAGRTTAETERLIGCFVNTVALRSDLSGNPSFLQLVSQVRDRTIDALDHQQLPFETLVGELRPTRTASHLPVAQVMFVLQGLPAKIPQPAGLSVKLLTGDTATSKADLTLCVDEVDGRWIAAIEYSTDLFSSETVSRYLGYFSNLLEAIALDPTRQISELPWLRTERDRDGAAPADNPEPGNVPSLAPLFQAQAARTPDTVAAVFGDESVTYAELNRRADLVAASIRAAGVRPGEIVAICIERCLGMLVGILGILKADAAYMPLDPTAPAERLAFMLRDAGATTLVTSPDIEGRLSPPAGTTLLIDRGGTGVGERRHPSDGTSPASQPEHGSFAYVLYTSGSTGTPKAAILTNSNVTTLFEAVDRILGPKPGVWLAISSLYFDASVVELLWTMARGYKVVIISEQARLMARGANGERELFDAIRRHGVTHLQCTPSFAQMLVELPEARTVLNPLKGLFVVGEVFPSNLGRELTEIIAGEVFNLYGPTETTVYATCFKLTRGEIGDTIPIGYPLSNTQVHLLDDYLQPVPPGVTGEAYIGGGGVGYGYLARPELTNERFVPDWIRGRGRLYRTGDLARARADGCIEYVGRVDHQVKLRGQRIELGEIDATLSQHAAVRDCVTVLARDSRGDEHIVSYLSLYPGCAAPACREYLGSRLPSYMVPSAFVVLPELPLSPNGKHDRAALPPAPQVAGDAGVAPRSPLEAGLVRIWESLLERRPIGVTDDFFDIGGHSLLAVRLLAKVEEAFGRKLPVSLIYEARSIEEFARRLASAPEAASAVEDLVAIQPGGGKTPIYFVHGIAGGMLWGYSSISKHLGADYPLFAFNSRTARGEPEFNSIPEMAAHYVGVLRRIHKSGPFILGGYCFGGDVAFEMARQLAGQGVPPTHLILINSTPPNGEYWQFRWRPSQVARFFQNLLFAARDFSHWSFAQQRQFVGWKLRNWRRALSHRSGGIDDLVDTCAFPEGQRDLLATHAAAVSAYEPGMYDGRVVLFRTRTYPILCSYDPSFGWNEFLQKPADVRVMPGMHNSIMEEPVIGQVARELVAIIDAARKPSAAPPPAAPLNQFALSPALPRALGSCLR